MDQWVIKSNGNFVPRNNFRSINDVYIHSPVDTNKIYIFYEFIERIWVTAMNPPNKNEPEVKEEWEE